MVHVTGSRLTAPPARRSICHQIAWAVLCTAVVGCASDPQTRVMRSRPAELPVVVSDMDRNAVVATDCEITAQDRRRYFDVQPGVQPSAYSEEAATETLPRASHQADELFPPPSPPASIDTRVRPTTPMTIRSPSPDRLPPLVNTRVSETFIESDVQEALQILASQAKAPVVIDEQVRGVTSAVIEDEPFEAALEKVLLPLGYVYRRVGNQYLIGVPDPASALFSRIAERYDYHTVNLSPSELMQLLPEESKRFVRTSEKRNLIIVEAPRGIAENILADLNRSDQAVGQVVLQVMVCVLSPERALQLGIDLKQGFPLSGGSAATLALSGLNLTGDYGSSALTPGLSSFSHTSAFLRALARDGHLSIRAAPHVMANDGETAKITIGKETFFSVQPTGVGVFFHQEIEKIEAGITLDITPVIRGDRVTMHIERAEVSEGIDNPARVNGTTDAFPTINRRHVSTTVNVLDGETITIGGLSQRQQVEQISRIPLLSDIPLVGKVFRRIDRREEETEVVIFISPRIVRQDIVWEGH
jgi:type IV pilus assembly protein PilQ